jgi:hypothetical protein
MAEPPLPGRCDMAQKTWMSTIATLFLLFAGVVYCPQADSVIGIQSGSGGYGDMPVPASFDREGCERYCRERYGVELYRRGTNRPRNSYYLYARCIQDCNAKFWKEYDREMRELQKEK